MFETIDQFTGEKYSKDYPQYTPGDTVKVHFKILEGDKERIQVFEGTIIAIKNKGPRSTITVRKISNGIGVERIFPVFSPLLQKITISKKGVVKRAKLYYLRSKFGKAAKVQEQK
ncbi:MAG: 50S ribosomal protein L19 [Candidatus Schekmanbacteria bacterium]|nr:50S ribosomal protein L19 [Candidatus Schekmanbacteria bacterium]